MYIFHHFDIINGKNYHNIDMLDYTSYTHFVIVHTDNNVYVTHASKFKYWFNDDNPPLLGSATDRQQDPRLVERANKYATMLLRRHKHKTWIFSDGSVAGKNRELCGGGYVIAKPTDNLINKTEANNYRILAEQSIKFNKCSIAKAELLSLTAALEHLKNTNVNDNSTITALCDNKQA